jgi:hypothetical protein
MKANLRVSAPRRSQLGGRDHLLRQSCSNFLAKHAPTADCGLDGLVIRGMPAQLSQTGLLDNYPFFLMPHFIYLLFSPIELCRSRVRIGTPRQQFC